MSAHRIGRIRRIALGAAAGACIALLAGCGDDPSEPEPEFELTPWLFHRATAVNNAGTVAGGAVRDSIELPNGTRHRQWRGATWTQDGGLFVLPEPPSSEPAVAVDIDEAGHVAVHFAGEYPFVFVWSGSSWASVGSQMAATGLAEDGSIVGGIEFQADEWTPMIATPSGSGSSGELHGWRDVGSCGGTTSAAPSDIAGDLVVGSTHGTPEAFIWNDVGGAELLFEYECAAVLRSTTTGINTAGDVIGWSEELDLSYVRPAGGTAIGLEGAPGAHGAARSCAYGISESGWIAGMSVTTNGDRAVRWSPARAPEDLGQGIALDVNDGGMTVGYSWPGRSHAMVWTPDGTPLALGGPNGTAGDPTSWWDGSLDDAPRLPRFILRPGFLPC